MKNFALCHELIKLDLGSLEEGIIKVVLSYRLFALDDLDIGRRENQNGPIFTFV